MSLEGGAHNFKYSVAVNSLLPADYSWLVEQSGNSCNIFFSSLQNNKKVIKNITFYTFKLILSPDKQNLQC